MARLSLKRSLLVCLAVSLAAILSVFIWHNVNKDVSIIPRTQRKFSKGEVGSEELNLGHGTRGNMEGKEALTREKELPLIDKWSVEENSSSRITVNDKVIEKVVKLIAKKYSDIRLDTTVVKKSVPLNQERVLSRMKVRDKGKHPIILHDGQSNIKETYQYGSTMNKLNRARNSSKTGRISYSMLDIHLSNNSTKKKNVITKSQSNQESLKNLGECFPRIMMVGFGKAGMKALFEVLKTRDDLVSLNSERRFFTKEYSGGIYQYLGAFPRPPAGGYVIEKSPDYIINILVPKRIKGYARALNIRFVVVLRDPIDRAISEYLEWAKKRRQKHEDELKPFIEMALTRSGKVSENQPFVKKSYYITYVTRWLRMFNSSKTCFVDGEQFAVNPYPELKLLEQCLGLKLYFKKSNFIYDKENGFNCFKTMVDKVCMNNSMGRTHPQILPEVKVKLIDYFRPMVDTLFQVIGRKLSWSNFEQRELA